MFNKKTKQEKLPKVIFQKVRAFFKTVDGEIHTGGDYNWCASSKLNCSVGQYLMIDIKDSGYIEDEIGTMYPLSNVLSIDWVVESQCEFIDEKSYEPCYMLFYSTDDLKKMTEYPENE